jgi:hypothetical protein
MTDSGRAAATELAPDQFGRRSTATIVFVVIVLALIVAGICVLTYVGNIEPQQSSAGVDHPGNTPMPPGAPGGIPGPAPGPAP